MPSTAHTPGVQTTERDQIGLAHAPLAEREVPNAPETQAAPPRPAQQRGNCAGCD